MAKENVEEGNILEMFKKGATITVGDSEFNPVYLQEEPEFIEGNEVKEIEENKKPLEAEVVEKQKKEKGLIKSEEPIQTEEPEIKEEEPEIKEEENASERTNLSLLVEELISKKVLPEFDIAEFDALPAEDQLEAYTLMEKESLDKKANDLIENWTSQMPDDLKMIIENYREGVEIQDILTIAQARTSVGSLTETDVEDENKAIKLLSYYYTKKNMTQDEIEEQLAILKESDKLIGAAKSKVAPVHSMIAQDEKQMKESVEQRKQEQYRQITDMNNKFKELIKSTEEIIPGIPLTEKDKQEIFNMSLPDKTGKSRLNHLWDEDSIGMQQKTNYYASIGLFDKKPNFTKILKELEKQAKEIAFKTIKGNEAKNKLTSTQSNSIKQKEKVETLAELLERNRNSSVRF